MLLRSEFACVELLIDRSANGPRLLIRDLNSGREILLDPLEVESITRMGGVFQDHIPPPAD